MYPRYHTLDWAHHFSNQAALAARAVSDEEWSAAMPPGFIEMESIRLVDVDRYLEIKLRPMHTTSAQFRFRRHQTMPVVYEHDAETTYIIPCEMVQSVTRQRRGNLTVHWAVQCFRLGAPVSDTCVPYQRHPTYLFGQLCMFEHVSALAQLDMFLPTDPRALALVRSTLPCGGHFSADQIVAILQAWRQVLVAQALGSPMRNLRQRRAARIINTAAMHMLYRPEGPGYMRTMENFCTRTT